MGVPGTGGQLLILVLFILPGSVYQVTRSRLRGPSPADQDVTSKILRALAVSTVLNAIYLIALGEHLLHPLRADTIDELETEVNPRLGGLVALVLLFLIPVLLGGLDYWRTQWVWIGRFLARHPRLRISYDPTPRAWDFGFSDQREPCFVRVLTGDGKWVGGWWGGDSFAASYPEPLEVYLESAWRLGSDGSFLEEVESGAGIYIRCDNAQVVEFLARTDPESDQDAGAEEEPAGTREAGARDWWRRAWPGAMLGAVLGAIGGLLAGRLPWP